MKTINLILKEAGLAGLTAWQIVRVIYFVFSLCLLSVSDDTHMVVVAAIVANLYVAYRLVRNVPIRPKID